MSTGTEQILFNGLAATHITAPDGATATILNQGAQIVSWIPAGGEERLYLSEKSFFEAGQPVRGGIPICFPQFGTRGPLPKHGFARMSEWELSEARVGNDFATATFKLDDDDLSRQIWPHAFTAELTAMVSSQRLDVELGVRNPGDRPLRFTCALHSYLRVNEVEQVSLEGLRGLHYLDATRGIECNETGTEVIIEEEIDRIYFDASRPLLLREQRRSLGIGAENFPDVVVWNPWEKLSSTLPDLPASGFRHMLCIESGAIGQPIELAPQEEWWGRQTLTTL